MLYEHLISVGFKIISHQVLKHLLYEIIFTAGSCNFALFFRLKPFDPVSDAREKRGVVFC